MSYPVVSTQSTPKTSTSTPSLWDQAQQMAQDSLNAQVAPLQGQIDANNNQSTADQAAAIANAQAVSKLLSVIGPQIQATFNNAANEQGVLGKGFSTDVQNSLNANGSDINGLLSKIGAPAGQNIDPSKAANVADVLYATGGYIPGSTFAQKGAAFSAAADMLPGTALLKGQQNAQQVRLNFEAENAKVQQNIAELASKLPGDAQSNYFKLQQLALDNAKFAAQLKNDQLNAAYKMAQMKLQQAKYQTGIAEFNAKQKLDYQKLQLQAQNEARQQFNSDRNYQLSLAKLGIQQQKLQLAIVQNSYKAANGGFTPKQITSFKSKAEAIALDAYSGHTVYTTVKGQKVAQKTAQLTYAEALQKELATGMPVQYALDALDRIYPANLRPTPEILAKELGPLTPENIQRQVQARSPMNPVNAPSNSKFNKGAAGGFLPPGASFRMDRADQGRDIQTAPGAAIIAPGDGYVVRVASDPGGGGAHFGPSYPIVYFTSGPYAGHYVYIGHTVSALRAGQHFHQGQVISHTQNSGPLNGGAPSGWAEIGFAPGGSPGQFGQPVPFG